MREVVAEVKVKKKSINIKARDLQAMMIMKIRKNNNKAILINIFNIKTKHNRKIMKKRDNKKEKNIDCRRKKKEKLNFKSI